MQPAPRPPPHRSPPCRWTSSWWRPTYASISNFGATDFDPALAHGAVVTHRAAALQNIVALARTANLTGINLDFEGVDPADRDAYPRFVTDLAAQLHAIHATLVLSVPAKTSDDSTNTWTWPYEYAALVRSADLMMWALGDEAPTFWSAVTAALN
ncbi:glycosyl hydrolase family 18 protein [Burkholderia sp. BCC0322]|uniref:glycosyl hydrolase family 18 protein n=1 Tax=unclassified Burkholderia TaxID=2613784 RepID=UPI00158C1B3A|nr:hypothetical protein [Burkholderia sp. BCC0322]